MKLAVIFNPVPESSRGPGFDEFTDWKAIEAGLKRAGKRYPDVIFTGIDFWADEKFSVFSHVGALSSHESSNRVGRLMNEIIGNKGPTDPARPRLSATSPTNVEIDLSEPYCGYGWTDENAATNGFPLKYVGPRDKVWIFMTFAPGSAFTVRSVFRADDPEAARGIELKANDMPTRMFASGSSSKGLYVDHLVSEEAVNAYGGWMTLQFDLGHAPEGT